jgi:hypothetical protein
LRQDGVDEAGIEPAVTGGWGRRCERKPSVRLLDAAILIKARIRFRFPVEEPDSSMGIGGPAPSVTAPPVFETDTRRNMRVGVLVAIVDVGTSVAFKIVARSFDAVVKAPALNVVELRGHRIPLRWRRL